MWTLIDNKVVQITLEKFDSMSLSSHYFENSCQGPFEDSGFRQGIAFWQTQIAGILAGSKGFYMYIPVVLFKAIKVYL